MKFEIVESPNPFTDFNSYLIVTKGANDNEASVQWTARFYRLYKLNPPIPEGQDDAGIRRRLLEDFDLEVGAGLGELAGKQWRIGLMGSSSNQININRCLTALEIALES